MVGGAQALFRFVMGGVTSGKLELSAAHEFRLSSRCGCA